MKIILENKVYVQICDLEFLALFRLDVPDDLYYYVYRKTFLSNHDNKYEFIAFEDQDSIDFLKSENYLFDYTPYINYTEEKFYYFAYCESALLSDFSFHISKLNKNGDLYQSRLKELKIRTYQVNTIGYILRSKKTIDKYLLPDDVLSKSNTFFDKLSNFFSK